MIGARGFPVAWVILIVSGAFEAVWAVALGKSDGFTRLWPSVVFFAALFVSMGGLAIAMRELPTGTSYAIWVAIGAVLAVTYSMVTGEESATPLKFLFIAMIIGGVVGMKAVS